MIDSQVGLADGAALLERALKEGVGIDTTSSDGTRETPKRLVKALRELTSGTWQSAAAPLAKTFSAEGYDEIVVVRGMPFVSLCEHHMLPFHGVVHFAYLPGERIVGLSKIPRMVGILAARLQVQERLTMQIAETFTGALAPKGVMVVVEGQHACMALRGAKSPGTMKTSCVRGVFAEKPEARAEALELLLR